MKHTNIIIPNSHITHHHYRPPINRQCNSSSWTRTIIFGSSLDHISNYARVKYQGISLRNRGDVLLRSLVVAKRGHATIHHTNGRYNLPSWTQTFIFRSSLINNTIYVPFKNQVIILKNRGVVPLRIFGGGKCTHATILHANGQYESPNGNRTFIFRSSLINNTIYVPLKNEVITLKNRGVVLLRIFFGGKCTHATIDQTNGWYESPNGNRTFIFRSSLINNTIYVPYKKQVIILKNRGVVPLWIFFGGKCTNATILHTNGQYESPNGNRTFIFRSSLINNTIYEPFKN
jgi:hypothetical protein